jgi:hypothetical protein
MAMQITTDYTPRHSYAEKMNRKEEVKARKKNFPS